MCDHEIEVCGYLHVHEAKVEQIRTMLPDAERLTRLSELFKVFGDGTRIR